MKQSSTIHGFLTILNIYTISVLLVSKKSTASDPRFEACLPSNISCGQGPNISFPFYISGLQQFYCGSPGFDLNCSPSGFPTLRIRDVEYVIEQIYYQNQSVRVYNSDMLGFNSSSSCVPRIENTTSSRSARYNFNDNTARLFFFYNCSTQYSFPRYQVSFCGDANSTEYSAVALYENYDGDLIRNATEYCTNNLVAPVDNGVLLDNYIDRRNIGQVLRTGFMMNWVAADCRDCEQSGGRCGFNDSFQCFCPDRPHSTSCDYSARYNNGDSSV